VFGHSLSHQKLVKNLKPNFIPGKKGKASYSDTNYQLLGRIIERIKKRSSGEVFHIPETDLYFTGTTNQIDGKGHQAAVKAILKIIKSVR
jgi:hypothetical protein